ncbi:anaphase-promoting complex component apc8, partial [Bonamia ostreae]
ITSHWTSLFFFIKVYEKGPDGYKKLEECLNFIENLFPKSEYVKKMRIRAAYEERYFDYAQNEYNSIHKKSPFDIEGMDAYSNILFVKGCKNELGKLARDFTFYTKHRPETALIAANYHSISGNHEKAAKCFSRATNLNRNYIDAWILLGHEFIELKQLKKAMKAYLFCEH